MKITIDSLFDTVENALNSKLPFAVYRYPDAKEIKGFFQKNKTLHIKTNFSGQGFVFAPFDDQQPSILFPLVDSRTVWATGDIFFEENTEKGDLGTATRNGRAEHLNLVQKGIDFLKATEVKKVVLSRKEILDYPNFKAVRTFKKLLKNYPKAMVYVWFHPEIGLWLGASPETLLRVKKNKFKTMALAGTQVYKGSLDVIWRDKEKQEQQYVTDYIIEKLLAAGNIRSIKGPQTIKAGSLVHLCTTIVGTLSSKFSLDTLLERIHPTPAVCGLPQKEAKRFILANENYNRTFYTGFLGELNLDNNSHLFVNLRCMEVLREKLALYIGGGITIDSIPEKEWKETVAKSEVMLKVLSGTKPSF